MNIYLYIFYIQREPTDYLGEGIPILNKGKKGTLKTIERLEAIISSPPSFHGSKRPSPLEDVVLLIDTHKMGAKLGKDEASTTDYLSHDRGSFREKNTNHSLVENGEVSSWTCSDVRQKKVHFILFYNKPVYKKLDPPTKAENLRKFKETDTGLSSKI